MKRLAILPILLLLLPSKVQAQDLEDYDYYIESVCETYDVCPELITSMIIHESRGQADVVSKNGKYVGLMQINPKVHKSRMDKLGVTDLKNAYQNILVGVDYVAELFELYDDPAKVLDAYSGQLHKDSWYESGNLTYYSKEILTNSAELERLNGK